MPLQYYRIRPGNPNVTTGDLIYVQGIERRPMTTWGGLVLREPERDFFVVSHLTDPGDVKHLPLLTTQPSDTFYAELTGIQDDTGRTFDSKMLTLKRDASTLKIYGPSSSIHYFPAKPNATIELPSIISGQGQFFPLFSATYKYVPKDPRHHALNRYLYTFIDMGDSQPGITYKDEKLVLMKSLLPKSLQVFSLLSLNYTEGVAFAVEPLPIDSLSSLTIHALLSYDSTILPLSFGATSQKLGHWTFTLNQRQRGKRKSYKSEFAGQMRIDHPEQGEIKRDISNFRIRSHNFDSIQLIP